MGYREDIIDHASEELVHAERTVEQIPGIIKPIQDNIDDLIIPLVRLDRRTCELTLPVNEKVRELEVLTSLITAGGVDACGKTEPDGDGGTQPVGVTVQFDAVQAWRNDSEDKTFVGMNPFDTTVFGQTTNMMSGTNFDTIEESRLGVGVTTIIGVGRTFFAQESDDIDGNEDPCTISNGDAYDTAYPDDGDGGDYVNVTYSARRTALLLEIEALRATRNNFMNNVTNDLKEEIKFKYVQRHSYIFGRNETIKRKNKLKNIIAIAEDDRNDPYFNQNP